MIDLLKNNYFKHKETIHNFTWRAIQTFGKQGITFLIFILCAKLLTPYDFGIYNYILAVIFFLIIFGDFGISTATSKYVAEFNATDKEKLKLVLFNSLIVLLSLGAVVTILTVLFGEYFLKEKYTYVLYVLPLLFLAPISSLYDGIFRGLKRFKELAVISLSVGIFSVGFVYFLVSSYGLIGALIAQVLFYLLLVLVLAFRYGGLYFQFDSELIKKIASYSFLIGVATVGYYLYTRIDIIILGQFKFIEEIGHYEIINKIFQILILPISIFATVVAPNTAKNFALEKYNFIFSKLKKELIYFFVIGLFFLFLTYITVPYLLYFLPDYDSELFVLLLNILLILIPFKFFSGYLSGAYIIPCGFVKISTYTLFIFGIINVFLSIGLIIVYGFIGVVYATVITHIMQILTKTIVFYFRFKKLVRREDGKL